MMEGKRENLNWREKKRSNFQQRTHSYQESSKITGKREEGRVSGTGRGGR